MFRDRIHAGQLLAARLKSLTFKEGIVLAIPRGGVPVASVIASELQLPCDLLMSKKIGHPLNPEFAIGSVTLHDVILDDITKEMPRSYIDSEIRRLRDSLNRKYTFFANGQKPLSLLNRDTIIVDDGLATGNTMLACIKSVKNQRPRSITVAVPVSSSPAAKKIRNAVDNFICLLTPDYFQAVGEFYNDFSEVPDETVCEVMRNLSAGNGVSQN